MFELRRMSTVWSGMIAAATLSTGELAAQTTLSLHLSWGRQSEEPLSYSVKLSGRNLTVSNVRIEGGEAEELRDGVVHSTAGAGDIDGLSCALAFPAREIKPIAKAQQIWDYVLTHGDPEAAQRLRSDPAFRPDPRKLTVELNESGTLGFSLSVDQLLSHGSFWFPELDLFVSAGNPPPSFADYPETLPSKKGERVLDRVAREPEASYAEYARLWRDMGHPHYQNPHAVGPGHIVGVTWDSALPKFGIDRLGGVWDDNAKTDPIRLSTEFGDDIGELSRAWTKQRLADGLPVITTTFEKGEVRCEIEQFAFPLRGPPAERRGDISMVLFQKTRLTELAGEGRLVPMRLSHQRGTPAETRLEIAPASAAEPEGRMAMVEDEAGRVYLAVENAPHPAIKRVNSASEAKSGDGSKRPMQNLELLFSVELPPRGSMEFVVKLPSPPVSRADRARLAALDYEASRAATLKFWEDYLARGTRFEVPEETVNTLFRANLWHALRLPRRHGGAGDVQIDLPYSNFAYGQTGTPWPINQAVYVDYMLYDLRGYHDVSAEELAVMYRNNQEPNGHVGGYANWGVYTPGMIYTTAQHYLLSGDRDSFESLLPQTLRALDWCLGEMRRANDPNSPTPGLIRAPLNDLSHDERSWAFNQAYFFAALNALARALEEIEHPRATECRLAARSMKTAIEREFARASVRSPAVQLADGSWSRYVPSDAQSSGRLMEIWYPTDVDTGALHLSRLAALDPRGPLTTALLEDHEDNLFFRQQGMANEPVYNQQATAYLLRDEPKAAIRAFYSMMTCAFSQTVFEPVEHRWGWGQYFGPPSTDGAWFELYRKMLIRETDDDALFLCQATPRAWLEHGQRIEVRRAPTYFGALSFTVESRAGAGEITATVDFPQRKRPSALVVRFRHPHARPIQSVTLNGRAWNDFDAEEEWVRVPRPAEPQYVITARY